MYFHICTYVRMYAVMHLCMYLCMYVCMHVCMYVGLCVCMHVYVCICMYYVCIMYACIHNSNNNILLGLLSTRTCMLRNIKKQIVVK